MKVYYNEIDMPGEGLEKRRGIAGNTGQECAAPVGDCAPGGLALSDGWLPGDGDLQRSGQCGFEPQDGGASGFWSDFDLIPCLDGKARRIESGTFPLVNGLSPRMGCNGPSEISFRAIKDKEGRSIGQAPWRIGMLRGYGNAIVPELAALFVEASMQAISDIS